MHRKRSGRPHPKLPPSKRTNKNFYFLLYKLSTALFFFLKNYYILNFFMFFNYDKIDIHT